MKVELKPSRIARLTCHQTLSCTPLVTVFNLYCCSHCHCRLFLAQFAIVSCTGVARHRKLACRPRLRT